MEQGRAHSRCPENLRSSGWPWFTAQEGEQEQIMVQQQQYPVHSQGFLGLQTILFLRGLRCAACHARYPGQAEYYGNGLPLS